MLIRPFHKKNLFWKLLLCSVDYVLGQIETDGRKYVCPNISASLRKWPPHPWFNVHVTLVWQKRRGSELKNLRANPVPIVLALLLCRTLQYNEHFGRHVQLIDLIKNSNTWLTSFIMLTNSVPFVINWFASFTLPLASSITVSESIDPSCIFSCNLRRLSWLSLRQIKRENEWTLLLALEPIIEWPVNNPFCC